MHANHMLPINRSRGSRDSAPSVSLSSDSAASLLPLKDLPASLLATPMVPQVLHVNGASQSGRSMQSVIKLLKTGELKDCPRVIVYCAYQVGSGLCCDSLATLVPLGTAA